MLAGLLSVENRRNVLRQARREDFLGVPNAGGKARYDFYVLQNLECFLVGHGRILNQAAARV